MLVLARRTAHHFDRATLDEHGDVWTIPTRPGDGGAHPAVMPVELARRCVVAGCPDGGTVFDPFAGAGTTGVAALAAGRRFVGVELHREHAAGAAARMGISGP